MLGLAIGGAVLICVIVVTIILCKKAHEAKIDNEINEEERERGVDDWGQISAKKKALQMELDIIERQEEKQRRLEQSE